MWALRYCSRGFSISSRRCVFKIDSKGLWSVMTWKCCNPAKNSWHFVIAQVIASISSSITAYLVSASDRKCEPAWIRVHFSPVCCCNMKPGPCLLASVQRRVGLLMSKNDSCGGAVRDFLTLLRASSWVADHRKSFLVLNSGLSGLRRVANELVLW